MRESASLRMHFSFLVALVTLSRSGAFESSLPNTRTYVSAPAGRSSRSLVVRSAFLDNLSGKREKLRVKLGIKESSSKDSDSDADPEEESKTTVEEFLKPTEPGSKLRVLKDIMWVRETLEDLTAAEFACTVEAAADDDSRRRRRKRAVDYEKLLGQLNLRLRDMGCADIGENASCDLDNRSGAGILTYTASQRNALMERLIRTRHLLLEVIKGYELELDNEAFSISLPELPELRVEIPREDDPTSPGPKLYVRDDGTVDWDGALQDQAAIKNFGTAVWARINGRDPETISNGEVSKDESAHDKPPIVVAKIEETEAIIEAREKLTSLSTELSNLESEYIALINSVISPGQAVANVNLAMLNPTERTKVRENTGSIEAVKEKVNLQKLIYELERVYTYLKGELGNPATKGYIPLQDRLNVAEFGLLESQIDSFQNQIKQSTSIDADVMAVVLEQMADFKRRLGIDYLVTGISFDSDAIKRYTLDLVEKSRKGLAFYAKGCKLFWNDIIFCLNLVNRAAQGYTLKPREVRTIRRTFKDFITFIPFVIILLIPLSPIGHVMVFGAIQRFYPDFFPSCFTEQRQNLLQLYETAEYREFSIDENWREKLARASEAMAYYLATSSRTLFDKMSASVTGSRPSSDDSAPNGSQNEKK